MVRIALFQSTTGIDPAANAERLVSAIGEAASGGAAMLFTPEMSAEYWQALTSRPVSTV